MANVYDVIDALREHCLLSQRKLAELAGILPNTMTTLMIRRPSRIPKKYLEALAPVFGLKWYELLNMTEADAERFENVNKLPSGLTEEDMAAILTKNGNRFHFFFKRNADGSMDSVIRPSAQTDASNLPALPQHESEDDMQYKKSILLMLNRLNTEGLLEAMHQVAAIARDPNLCRGNTKGDTIWQKEKLLMAAEHSENERMVVGKDSTSSDETPEQES